MTYEHQERYRRRTLLKAKYFDEANADRIHALRWAAKDLAKASPEIRACVPYFLSHPQASYIPLMTPNDDPVGLGWYTSADRDSGRPRPDFHAALAYVALTSVSRLSVMALVFTDGGCGQLTDSDPEVVRVRKEIEELRACGMWVTE